VKFTYKYCWAKRDILLLLLFYFFFVAIILFLLLLHRVYRPFRPSRHTLNPLTLSISRSCLPVRFLIQWLHVLPHYNFSSQTKVVSKRESVFSLRQACSAHWNLRQLIVFIMFCFWKSLQLIIFRYSPLLVSSVFTGSNIFLKLFLSKSNNFYYWYKYLYIYIFFFFFDTC